MTIGINMAANALAFSDLGKSNKKSEKNIHYYGIPECCEYN